MGYFKIRRSLAVHGGSVQLAADVNLYRASANELKTDDGFTVTGKLAAGTALFAPHGTAVPDPKEDGDVQTYQKSNVGAVTTRIGGTVYTLGFPSASHGTVTITVGTPP